MPNYIKYGDIKGDVTAEGFAPSSAESFEFRYPPPDEANFVGGWGFRNWLTMTIYAEQGLGRRSHGGPISPNALSQTSAPNVHACH